MSSKPSVQDVLCRTFIVVQKFREHLEAMEESETRDTNFTVDELRVCGVKRKRQNDLDDLTSSGINQVKILENSLSDMLEHPKYIGVGAIKSARNVLNDNGFRTDQPPKLEEEEDEEEEDEEEDEEREDEDADDAEAASAKSKEESIDGEESDEDDEDFASDSSSDNSDSDDNSDDNSDNSDDGDSNDESSDDDDNSA